MTSFVKSVYLDHLRYRGIFWIGLFFIVSITVMLGAMYPGEEGMKAYIETIDIIIGTIDAGNPSYLLWILLTTALFLQYYFALFGIFIGAKFLTFQEKSGKELLMSTPTSPRKMVLKNVFMVAGQLIVMGTPGVLAAAVLLYLNDSFDSFSNLLIIFFLGFITAFFFAMLSAFGGVLFFSKNMAYVFGASYFGISLFISIIGNSIDIEGFSNLSIIYQADIIKNGMNNTLPLDYIFLVLFLTFVLILLCFFFIIRKDYFEGIASQEEKVKEVAPSAIKEKIGIIRTPMDKILSSLGWRFPIVRDQLNVLAIVFTLTFVATSFILFYIFIMYPGDLEFSTLMTGFSSPIITAPMFNHEVLGNITGFFAVEVFAFIWIYYAPFLLLAVNSICLRDYNTKYGEITWALPRSETSIITRRTISAILALNITVLANAFVALLTGTLAGYDIDALNLLIAFITVAYAYSLYIIFFVALVLFLPNRISQKGLLIGFFFSLMLLLSAFILDIEILLYLTPFGYFDHVGIYYGIIEPIVYFPKFLLFTIITLMFYLLVIRFRSPQKDLI